jgi:hypothetical protein
VAGSCEHGNEPLGSLNVGNFLTVSDCQLLKEHSAAWSWLVQSFALHAVVKSTNCAWYI